MNTRYIVIVDDEPSILHALRRLISTALDDSHQVSTFCDPIDALEFCRTMPVDLVISDYAMPDINGSDFLTLVRAVRPSARRVVLSGNTNFGVLRDLINDAEIFRFLVKPWNEGELLSVIALALDATHAEAPQSVLEPH